MGDNITVINWAGLNYGDNEIFKICYRLFFEKFYENIYLIADNPYEFKKLDKVKPISRVFGIKKKWIKVFKAIISSEKIFVGGGDILNGEIGTSMILILACILKKEFIIAGVGVVPIKSKRHFKLIIKKLLLSYLLNRSKLIIVRDSNSHKLIKLYTKNNNIYQYPDLCFLYEFIMNYNNIENINIPGIDFDKNKKYFAVNVIPQSEMYNNYWGEKDYQFLSIILDKLIEQGFIPIFINGVCKFDLSKVNYNILSDDEIAKLVICKMKYKDKCIVLNRTFNFNQLSFILKHCDFAILMRLHFVITSIINRVPFLALDYAPKLYNILKDMNLLKYSIKWPEDKNKLLMKLFYIYENKEKVRIELDTEMNNSVKMLLKLYNLIEKNLKK